MKKISRAELREIIAEAGSFGYADGDPKPLDQGEVMARLRRGEDVEGVEASGADMSYQAKEYIPTIKRAHSMIAGLKSELDAVRFGRPDETALIRNEIEDAHTSLENILKALGVIEVEHKDMGGMVGRIKRGRSFADDM